MLYKSHLAGEIVRKKAAGVPTEVKSPTDPQMRRKQLKEKGTQS